MTDASLPPPPAQPQTSWPPAEPTMPEPGSPRRSRAALFVGLGLSVALIAGMVTFAMSSGRETHEGGPSALSLAFAKGETTRYRISMHMDASVDLGAMGEQPMDMDMTQTVAWKVVSVDDEGVATVELTIERMQGSVNGVDAPSGIADQTLEFQITPDGQILSTTGVAFGASGGTGVGGFPGMDQMTPILPDGEVEPGDSWDKEFSQEFPFGEGTLEYTAHSTLEGYETVDGVETAVIATTYDVPIDFTLDFADLAEAFGGSNATGADEAAGFVISYGGSGEFSQRAWVDLDRREVLRSTSDGTFEMTIGMKGAPEGAEGFPLDGVTLDGSFGVQMERL